MKLWDSYVFHKSKPGSLISSLGVTSQTSSLKPMQNTKHRGKEHQEEDAFVKESEEEDADMNDGDKVDNSASKDPRPFYKVSHAS